MLEELKKSFGRKDFSKLTKKQITDKNGRRTYVWTRVEEKQKEGKQKNTETSNPKNSSHTTGVSSTGVSVKKKESYNGNIGDIISFNYTGNQFEGKIIAIGKDDVIVDGTGKSKGVRYKVLNENIIKTTQNSDGTIPASSFNANDYKKSFTDSKCTNDANGVEYVYSLLGEEGKETKNKVEEKLKEQVKRLEKKGDTFSRNTVNGEWTDERKKLHEKIIKNILSPEKIKSCTPKKGEKPKFIMFGGRGGSGKSWFTDKKRAVAEGREVMFDSDKYLILDADAIKEYIPEYEGWNAGEVHEESSYLNKEIKRRAFEAGLNIIIDGTMNYNPKKPDKVKNEMLEAKGKGYSLEAHYMFTPIQKSCVNAMNRFKTKKGDFSGRLVPTNILLGMQDNEKSFDSVKDIVDNWTFRDNQNFEAKLIAQKNK